MTGENHGLFYKFSRVFISLPNALFLFRGDRNERKLGMLRILRWFRKQNELLRTR